MDKILIIDDDEELCELVSEFLEGEGFEAHCVNDGEAGLERARSGDYDMAILDVMLPKMNGIEVLKNLRKDSSLPILMLTARGDDAERVAHLRALGVRRFPSLPYAHRPGIAGYLNEWAAALAAEVPECLTSATFFP